ncbi:timeless-domain-containing protein [Panus rudis PR-1116 ss-1]|nr:timeless-domain-containing protein [Panus rudis PR-1116 ss-1]
MNRENPIEILSGDEDDEYVDRRAILEPAIQSVVDALGGYEGEVYRLGDECYGCLKDLKKYWRKDDTDDERTVARIFWETRLLPNDLIPILLQTAGKGHFDDKRAIACADLMTAMTWPIDLAEELQELDETEDKGADYTQLLQSHLAYKAAMLKPGVIQALFGIMLACIAKDAKKERTERDVQVVNVVLYLIRNLAFIKDLPPNMHLSADQAEYSTMQSRFIKILSETSTLDLLLTMASNAPTDPMFNSWNTLLLEIFYLLCRGVKPSSLAEDQSKQPAKDLQRLLALEGERRRVVSRNASSRHSRFGTTIAIMANPKKQGGNATDAPDGEASGESSSRGFVLHRQRALHENAGAILDMSSAKRAKAQKNKKVDELAREDNLSLEAKTILQGLAKTFLESCFNPFLSSLLKDIKAERAKIMEKDNLRLLYVTKWFLEFFRYQRTNEKERVWEYGLVAEVIDRSWIVWVLRRMREAVEDKPKLWTELQAGIDCLTQLVLLIDAMAQTTGDPTIADAAQTLQQQIIYNGEILDISLESMRTYKEGTQSLAYLESSVYLAYSLLRMLEKWSKRGSGEVYVRKKTKKKRKAKQNHDTEAGPVPDVEEEEEKDPEEEEIIHEQMFTFDSFEARFAHPDVTQTLLMYLSRYKEFTSTEHMKRIVNLLHRQAVKAKAEGLFFKVSTLDLFKTILAEEKTLPREQPYKDLIALINYILRRFFKAVEEDPFVIVQAFFPKNRGQWKHFSSWEPEEKPSKGKTEVDSRFPPDVKVKKGYKWSEELAIAMQCLQEEGKEKLIDWVKEILQRVIDMRQRIIEETDGPANAQGPADLDDLDDEQIKDLAGRQGPSSEAINQFKDYMIPYVDDEQADAATKNPHLKLMFRLVHFFILEEDAEELEWYVPASILPSDLQRSLNVINQYLETPLDLEGKKATSLLQKQRRKRRRRRSPSKSASDQGSDEDEPQRKKKREKKKKEEKKYKSAQFIEDSDADESDMAAFFEREKALRERTALAAAATGKVATMKATGTKKRRKKGQEKGTGAKRRKKNSETPSDDEGDKADDEVSKPATAADESSDDEDHFDPFASIDKATKSASPTRVAPRPRPRPRPKRGISHAEESSEPPISEPATSPPPSRPPSSPPQSPEPNHDDLAGSDDDAIKFLERPATKKKPVVISDDEE